jgi:hypothetical protein
VGCAGAGPAPRFAPRFAVVVAPAPPEPTIQASLSKPALAAAFWARVTISSVVARMPSATRPRSKNEGVGEDAFEGVTDLEAHKVLLGVDHEQQPAPGLAAQVLRDLLETRHRRLVDVAQPARGQNPVVDVVACEQPVVIAGQEATLGFGHQSGAVLDQFGVRQRRDQPVSRQRQQQRGDQQANRS